MSSEEFEHTFSDDMEYTNVILGAFDPFGFGPPAYGDPP